MNNEDSNDRDALIASYLADDPDFAKNLVEQALNAVLEGEMTELLGCEKGERSTSRRGYRSGHYTRQLTMKVGTLELRVPQDRDWALQYPGVRALSSRREGVGVDSRRDVCERHVDAESGQVGRRPLWACVFPYHHFEHGGGTR